MLYTVTIPSLPEMGQRSGPRGQFRDHVMNRRALNTLIDTAGVLPGALRVTSDLKVTGLF